MVALLGRQVFGGRTGRTGGEELGGVVIDLPTRKRIYGRTSLSRRRD